MSKQQCMALLDAMDDISGEMQFSLQNPDTDVKVRDFIFTYMDENNSGTIDPIEYEKLLLLCRCCAKLSTRRMLAYKCTIARAELVQEDALALLTMAVPPHMRQSIQTSVPQLVAEQQVVLAGATDRMLAYKAQLEACHKVFGVFPMKSLDDLCVVLVVIHFWAQTLNSSVWWGCSFNVLYCFELVIRVHTLGSLALLFKDPRGSEQVLQNKTAFWTTVVGMCGVVVVIVQETSGWHRYRRVLKAILLTPFLRLFVMSTSYRRIVRALLAGVRKISFFVALFLILFYIFCMVAYSSFRELNPDVFESDELNFSTFGDSCLAMFQVSNNSLVL